MKEKKKKTAKRSNTKKHIKTKNENIKNKEPKTRKKRTRFKDKHPKLSIMLKILIILILLLFVIGAGVAVGLIYGLWGDDLQIDLSELALAENSVIVDSEGNVLAELNGDESRKIISLEQMPTYLPNAYIAIEDERFKQHQGVDLKRTGAAILSFVTHKGKSTAGGGSTITQQLVKNITQEKDSRGLKGIERKLKEWARAYEIEKVMSKDQIIELYLNLIFVGGKDYHGVEIASEYYFGKSAKDLSIAQCAFLAGINNSPNAYNPYAGKDVTEKITKRTKTVLKKMKDLGYLVEDEYNTAIAEVDAGFEFKNGISGNIYSSHTDALITQLVEQIMNEKQISKDAAETYLYSSGLTIYSTQVSSIQSIIESETTKSKYNLKSRKEKDENGNAVLAQGAVVVIDEKTGYVVGAVGQLGEKNTSRGLNRVNSPRQTGSSIKPLADVLPGLEEGKITAATKYADLYTIFGKNYDPQNYNAFSTIRTVRTALTTSQNIPFIKIMAEVTPKKSMEYLKKMGVTSLDDEKDNNLSIAIGGMTYGISPLEMAGAYAAIANDGVYIKPTFYSKVEDQDGKIVLQPVQTTEKVCSPETAYIIKNLMISVVKGADGYGGTGSYCGISGMDTAVKTGTTNDVKDRWLCGFTNYYSCAIWFGFDKPERISMSSGNSSGGMWASIMRQIHKGLPASSFTKPEGIISANVCRESGLLATDRCTDTYSEIFDQKHLPDKCDAHTNSYTVCKDSGLLINEFCPESSHEVKSGNYIVEKERLGLWNTPGIDKTTNTAPTEYCNVHKKQEVVVPPVQQEPEPPEEPKKPEEQKPEENKPEPEEPEQPETPTDPVETPENQDQDTENNNHNEN